MLLNGFPRDLRDSRRPPLRFMAEAGVQVIREFDRRSLDGMPAYRDDVIPSREPLADLAWFRDAQSVVNAEAIASNIGAPVSVTGCPPTAPHPAG